MVQGIPEQPWRSNYDGELGVDPSRIYFEDVDYSLPSALQEPPSPEPAPSGGAGEKLPSEAEAALRRFVETGDRNLLYNFTRSLSMRQLSTGLRQLPVTIRPSGENAPRALIDWQASEPSEVLEDLRALRGDGATFHLLVVRQFIVPIPDRLGNPRSWKNLVLYSTFRDGKLSEPVVVCEGCSKPAASVAPDGSLWLVTADDRGLSARQRSRDGAWSAPEPIVEDNPRMIRGFDLAIDGRGSLFVVWAPWYGKEDPATLRLRVRNGDGWQPAEAFPMAHELEVMHPRARWLSGELGILAAVKEGAGAGYSLTLYLRKEKERLDRRKLSVNGSDLASSPSGEPLLFVQHFFHPAATAELQQLQVVGTTQEGEVAELDGLAVPAGGYGGGVGPATDATGHPLVLAGWDGHVLVLGRADPGHTRAALLALASKADVVGDDASPRPPMIGSPQLFVAGNRFEAFWLETRWRMEGTQPRPKGSQLWYLSGDLSELDWHDVAELASALRPTTGLLRSDLAFLGQAALAEARVAEERGDTRGAMERYIWLIESSRDLGNFLGPDSASLPGTWIAQRFRAGDAEVRDRLWELAAERPLFFAPDSSFLRLLAEEIGPRERIERAKPRAETP